MQQQPQQPAAEATLDWHFYQNGASADTDFGLYEIIIDVGNGYRYTRKAKLTFTPTGVDKPSFSAKGIHVLFAADSMEEQTIHARAMAEHAFAALVAGV